MADDNQLTVYELAHYYKAATVHKTESGRHVAKIQKVKFELL